MKKILALSLALVILLFSCGTDKKEQPEKVVPEVPVERTAEEQALDKELIMLLREQLAGEYDVKNAEFSFAERKEIEGVDCNIYKMTTADAEHTFAVALDETVIYEIISQSGVNKKIYNLR